MEDMIMFEAIFIPKPNNENTNIYGRNARLVVSAEVYKLITGFYPITYNEYYGMPNLHTLPNGEEYFYQNSIFHDKVNMFVYELLYSSKIDASHKFDLEKMILQLEKENRIKHINIALKPAKKD